MSGRCVGAGLGGLSGTWLTESSLGHSISKHLCPFHAGPCTGRWGHHGLSDDTAWLALWESRSEEKAALDPHTPGGGSSTWLPGEGQGGAGLTGGPGSSPPPVLVTMGKLRSGKGKVGPRPHRDVGASWAKAPHATPQVLSLRSVSDGNHG